MLQDFSQNRRGQEKPPGQRREQHASVEEGAGGVLRPLPVLPPAACHGSRQVSAFR